MASHGPLEPFTASDPSRPPSRPISRTPSLTNEDWAYRTQPKVTLSHKGVSVLFSDIVGFTNASHQLPPQVIMKLLHELFVTFDHINVLNDTYKVETIGDVRSLLFTCKYFPL